MPSLAQSVADLTFAYAEREAVWLNRYNKDGKSVEWAFKEGFYQKRIRELLGLIADEHLEKLQAIITARLEHPPGEATRRRSPANGFQKLLIYSPSQLIASDFAHPQHVHTVFHPRGSGAVYDTHADCSTKRIGESHGHFHFT